jgi:hypothetical protein
MAYHPSDISLRERHCGYAITLKKNGATRDRNVFQVGIAAHAVLEEVGKAIRINPDLTPQDIKQIADNTAHELCTKGRAYDRIPEPPMKISQAIEGAKIALQYMQFNPLDPEALYEQPLAFDKDWNQVDYYDENAAFRTLLDYLHIYKEIDEDGEATTYAIVRDYKSSWYLNTEMLDNLQRRAQALVVCLAYEEVDVLLLQIHGLRNNQKLERKVYTHHELDLLNEWKDNITLALKALNETQIPDPGTACYGCPYIESCEYAKHESQKKIANQYAIAISVAKELEKKLRAMAKEQPIKTNNATIGYVKKERNTTAANAMDTLWKTWHENKGTTEAFLDMLKITAADAKKIIKALSKNGLDKDALLESTMITKNYSQFGIHKE